jgi:protease I
MRDHGHNVVFATPTGRTGRADPKMVTGEGLGILSPLLKADANGRSAYLYMEQSDALRQWLWPAQRQHAAPGSSPIVIVALAHQPAGRSAPEAQCARSTAGASETPVAKMRC